MIEFDFDVLAYLEALGLEVKERGNNIGRESISIQCINPDCCDDRGHFNIHQEHGFFHCWKCDIRGSIVDLISVLEQIPKREVFDRLKNLVTDVSKMDTTQDLEEQINKILNAEKKILKDKEKPTKPLYMKVESLLGGSLTFKPFLRYIEKRRFTISELSQWETEVDLSGKRLVFHEDDVYVSRDITGHSSKRYLNKGDTSSILYGSKYLKTDHVIIVEGCFDAIRVGQGRAVACLGKAFGSQRIKTLVDKGVRKVSIMLDREGYLKSLTLKENLEPFFKEVNVVEMKDDRDPADLNLNEINQLLAI